MREGGGGGALIVIKVKRKRERNQVWHRWGESKRSGGREARTDGRTVEEERRGEEKARELLLVTFVIEFSHPAFPVLPPSLLSLLLLVLSSAPSPPLSPFSFPSSLVRSLIAAVTFPRSV